MKEEAGSPVAAKHKEQVMKTSLITLAFAAISTLVISTASAQQVRHGSVSKIDEPNGTINQTTTGTSSAVGKSGGVSVGEQEKKPATSPAESNQTTSGKPR
jgi:hypothetical protein